MKHGLVVTWIEATLCGRCKEWKVKDQQGSNEAEASSMKLDSGGNVSSTLLDASNTDAFKGEEHTQEGDQTKQDPAH